jgi:hypothetical protein
MPQARGKVIAFPKPLPLNVEGFRVQVKALMDKDPSGFNLPKEHVEGMKSLLDELSQQARNPKHLVSLVKGVNRDSKVKNAHEMVNSAFFTHKRNMEMDLKRTLKKDEMDKCYDNAMKEVNENNRQLALRGIYANLLLAHFDVFEASEKQMAERYKAA